MLVKILFFICVVCALHCNGATEVSSESNIANRPIDTSDSFGYEVLLGKLEDLESKFWNMWLEMKEQNEQIMRNHSLLENTHQGMLWMLTRLEQAVGHNMTTVMDRSWEILQQQISCANHENWKQSVLEMLQNKTIITFKKQLPTMKSYEDCTKVLVNTSGKYIIHPQNFPEPFEAYCAQEVFEGGWLVVQYRFDGSVDFYRNWTEYRNGFGTLDGEFWIGLEKLHRLTKNGDYELIVELKDYDGTYIFARYDDFEIDNEEEKYSLKKLGSYTGSAGDSLSYHKSMKFSTFDSDNDLSSLNCAKNYDGGWWYKDCHYR
ncbi:AAEL011633-PA [Aedes aegypti]|uniref:AAEL011633-PA n=1 Tax=Aedes aegypti TaxID=7159 RepID=Q16PI8_AEDAE|nr:AAEL011633-PA [Aedes aegypti]